MASILTVGALIAGTGGLVLLTVPAVYGLARATFWRKRRQNAVENQTTLATPDFTNVMNWDCYWTTVAVVGYERTGKTQLKKRLRGMTNLSASLSLPTDNLEIHLGRLDDNSRTYMALLDHAGATDRLSAGQADLMERAAATARVIILVMDHADTERQGIDISRLDPDRLEKQEMFIKQSLANRLVSRNGDPAIPLRAIFLVMNKADIWEATAEGDKLREWAHQQADLLRAALPCDILVHFLSVEDFSHPGFGRFQRELSTLCKETR